MDKKKVEFRLMDIKVAHDELALALTDPKKEKRLTRYQVDDWSDVDIKSVSEIIMASMKT
ncbi:unnamed protein product [Eruca vesicaria subsp. sativa]|uniref:Uncharacterized protein n=1 Tax=Eruca vesicaria subsp. sativa TaxID=29727 RepID=A0ABC8IVC8_ERUVS|nr:unnamed protein product [Eruca vesicaria subsp. sativa]